MAKAKPNETVWFSFIVYKSRKHRDEVNAKVMEEMNKQTMFRCPLIWSVLLTGVLRL